jgi:hypothetical protein
VQTVHYHAPKQSINATQFVYRKWKLRFQDEIGERRNGHDVSSDGNSKQRGTTEKVCKRARYILLVAKDLVEALKLREPVVDRVATSNAVDPAKVPCLYRDAAEQYPLNDG